MPHELERQLDFLHGAIAFCRGEPLMRLSKDWQRGWAETRAKMIAASDPPKKKRGGYRPSTGGYRHGKRKLTASVGLTDSEEKR